MLIYNRSHLLRCPPALTLRPELQNWLLSPIGISGPLSNPLQPCGNGDKNKEVSLRIAAKRKKEKKEENNLSRNVVFFFIFEGPLKKPFPHL